MAVGNLPNELPRDASRYFGEQLIKFVLKDLIEGNSRIIDKATIVKAGKQPMSIITCMSMLMEVNSTWTHGSSCRFAKPDRNQEICNDISYRQIPTSRSPVNIHCYRYK